MEPAVLGAPMDNVQIPPCCQVWRKKYYEVKERRNCLKQAVNLLNSKFEEVGAENFRLKKAIKEEQARANVVINDKEYAIAARALLEKEIASLKSEISSLKQKEVTDSRNRNGEIEVLQVQVSDREKEIGRLKELFQKAKKKAVLEAKNTQVERKKAAEASKRLKAEKNKVDEERRVASLERKKAEEFELKLEALNKEIHEAKLKLVSEMSKFKEASEELVAERQKVTEERLRANLEMSKAEEQRKLAEANMKKALEEVLRSNSFSEQLEDARRKIEELKEEIYKFPPSTLSGEATFDQQDINISEEAVKKGKETQMVFEVLQSGIANQNAINEKYGGDAETKDSHKKDRATETAETKQLKKRIKFEKQKAKHIKEVANLERVRSSILQQELSRVKLDLMQFYERLDVIDKCFLQPVGGKDEFLKSEEKLNLQRLNLKEKCSLRSSQTNIQSEDQHLAGNFVDITSSGPLCKTCQHSAPQLALCRGTFNKAISGTNSKLEFLLEGSKQKILGSYVLNSSTASFSDRLLVGSQERCSYSVGTSAGQGEDNLNGPATISDLSAEVSRSKSNTNLAVVAENSVRSPPPTNIKAKVNVDSRKRKRISDALASSELSFSEIKKLCTQVEDDLSVLRCMLNKRSDKSSDGKSIGLGSQSISQDKHDGSHKRRRKCHYKRVVPQIVDFGQAKQIEKLDTAVQKDANMITQPSKLAFDRERVHRETLCCSVPTDASPKDVVNEDFLKLLDLDNANEEKSYRMAIEMPLSPTLPEINFPGPEIFDSIPLVDESLHKGFSSENQTFPSSCTFDMIDAEIDSNWLKYNMPETANGLFQQSNGVYGDIPRCSIGKFSDTMLGEGDGFQSSGMDAEIEPPSGVERVKTSAVREIGCASQSMPRYCFVVSNVKDRSSISRIIRAIRSCEAQCSLASQPEFLVHKIALALKMEEKLSSREKVCVFFSLMLFNFSVATSGKCSTGRDFISCFNSFTVHINAVMCDAEWRTVISEFNLDELLNLIEDYLIDGRLMVYVGGHSQTFSESYLTMDVVAGGVNAIVSSVAASTDEMVAGSIILGSLCTALGQSEFICEAGCNILWKHIYDTSVVLTILHVLAYFGSLSVDGGSCPYTFHQSVECPFSKDAASVENVMSLLLEDLNAHSATMMHEDLMVNSLNPTFLRLMDKIGQASWCEEVSYVIDINCDASCYIDKSTIPDELLEDSVRKTLCHITNILLLVELVASKMSWNWTCSEIIKPLLRMLDSPLPEVISLSIVMLLGQLGRLGVESVGYEDRGIENLRSQLSAFLWRDSIIRAGLPFQIATISSLLGLMPFDMEKLYNDNEKPPNITRQFDPIDLVRNWLHSLSEEARAFSITLLQSICGLSKKVQS